MDLVALSFSANSTRRLEELAALLGAVAGALLALGAVIPSRRLRRRAGQLLAGIALIAAGLLAILALHYGRS